MRPGLSEGDFIIAFRRRRAPRPGERVVFDHPSYGTLIKRVDGVHADGTLRCSSDNPAGLDGNAIGPVDPGTVRGIAWRAIRQPTRR
jgi:hypothetical protein